FKTDVNGLVSLQDQAGGSKRLLDLAAQSNPQFEPINPTVSAEPAATASDTMAAQDQVWSEELAKSSLAYGLLLFFGL
ncbi:thiol:disulfide interchange protein, partial [bacterium LRH843]|nr:thiol:disulfide interchange protein [bacterium LRH843]